MTTNRQTRTNSNFPTHQLALRLSKHQTDNKLAQGSAGLPEKLIKWARQTAPQQVIGFAP
jgi:hypothetical protein